jgi:phosphoribosylformylglycinamidine synthase
MTPYEIMLSESQERMLIIVHRGREAEVKRIFDKWDLPWAEIGVVTDTGRMVVRHHGQVVADIPASKLADEAPLYQREAREPEYLKAVRAFKIDQVPALTDPRGALESLLHWPVIASKNWVFRQYDYTVRAGTAVCPGSDAAVVRIKADSLPNVAGDDSAPVTPFPDKYVAISVDCNASYVYLDPYEGGKIAVAEAARNLACSGARPLGVTDNLNFGNPHNPEIFWQLRESVRGLAEACVAFNAPVTGGNVSLYNQSPNGPIDPTPTVAVVGLIDDPKHITTQWFKDEGDVILLLGALVDESDPLLGLGGSAYLQHIHGMKTGSPPRCDLEREGDLHLALRALIHSGSIKSAHDCSEGGLAVAIAECCVSRQTARETPNLIGAAIDFNPPPPANDGGENDKASKETPATPLPRLDALLFGESQGRVVITTSAVDAVKVIERARLLGVNALRIGTVGGQDLKIKAGSVEFASPVSNLHDLWWHSIAKTMKD